MTRPILVDTDILVDFFRGRKNAVDFINKYSDRIILSAIGVAELFAGVKGDKEKAVLEDFFSIFPVIPVSRQIVKRGGLYKRSYGKSHGIGLSDAVIAATAELENAELKTLNIKHYPMFKGLRPAYK